MVSVKRMLKSTSTRNSKKHHVFQPVRLPLGIWPVSGENRGDSRVPPHVGLTPFPLPQLSRRSVPRRMKVELRNKNYSFRKVPT
jgi:hypothetical protein